jgi:predicted nucleic acid-binding protein
MNSDRICLDASVAVAWLILEKYSAKAIQLRKDWNHAGIEMVAPALFHSEVVSVIRKKVYFKGITPGEGEEIFSIYQNIPVRIIEGIEIYRRAWELSAAYNLPVCYNSQYLAVAEILDCPLWTNDSKFVNTLRGRSEHMRWLGDYSEKED